MKQVIYYIYVIVINSLDSELVCDCLLSQISTDITKFVNFCFSQLTSVNDEVFRNGYNIVANVSCQLEF